jgi:hypothetical protein
MPVDRRTLVIAIVCGLVADGAVVVVSLQLGDHGALAGPLFLLEAVVLGWVFGSFAGPIAASLPVLVFALIDLVGSDSDAAAVIVFGLAGALILAAAAWFVGVMRERLRRAPGTRR